MRRLIHLTLSPIARCPPILGEKRVAFDPVQAEDAQSHPGFRRSGRHALRRSLGDPRPSGRPLSRTPPGARGSPLSAPSPALARLGDGATARTATSAIVYEKAAQRFTGAP